MPAAAPVEPGSSSSAIISAISVALPMGSSDSGPSRAVVAALGTEPVQPNDALFPTYGRPLYPFTLLDRQKARLLPLPSDRRFPTELEAKHAIQEHALNQGYKLEATIDGKHGKVWRCRTGSKCRYAAKIRKDDQGAWAVESGIDGNHQHTHGASFRIGTLYWSRGLTREEIAALRKCSDAGRLKSIFDLMAFVVYSRKRLSSVIPLPGVPFFASFWERFCSSRWPEGTEVLPTPNPSQASPVAPVAPLTDPAPSKVIELLERDWPAIKNPAFVIYQCARPVYPFVALDPAKALLLPPPEDQVFDDHTQMEAVYALQEHGLLQGYELKSDWKNLEVHLHCHSAVGCPFRLIIRERFLCSWEIKECHGEHNHGPDLELGPRQWSSGLNPGELDYIEDEKGRAIRTIDDVRAVVERSRKRLHKDIPLPTPPDYDKAWRDLCEWERTTKRKQITSTSRTSTAGPVSRPLKAGSPSSELAAPTSNSRASVRPLDSSLTHSNSMRRPATSQTTSQAQDSIARSPSLTNKDTLKRGFAEMVDQLWPDGVRDPQGMIRAAVKAMLNDDQAQQQQPAV